VIDDSARVIEYACTGAAAMGLATLKTEFWEQGFLVLEDFFDDSEMDAMDTAITAHFGDEPEFWHEAEFLQRSKTEVIPWFPQNPELNAYDAALAAPFDRLEGDRRLAGLTDALLGSAWSTLYCMVMFSRRGSSGQAWHQDCPPEEPARHNLNRLVYTRDLSTEIGGQTVVMPGSHRRGELPVGDPHEDLEGQVVLNPRKGTLVLLHGHTWHRVLPVTGGHRFSTNYRACPAGTPADITDVCVYRNMRYSFASNSVVEERGGGPVSRD
jgi:ectoine hydroxylase-related dioxygenase (phytanoyl-CoA dioxygenase family)